MAAEFGYQARVTITSGFYKDAAGTVLRKQSTNDDANPEYLVRLDTTGLEMWIEAENLAAE